MANLLLLAGRPERSAAIARRIAGSVQSSFIGPQLRRHLDFMEAELAAYPWFAGEEFTAADVQMSFPLEAAVSRAGLNAGRPRLSGFLERIHARAKPRVIDRVQATGPGPLGIG